jgi:predicted nucleic acid-binding protein
LYLIDTSSLILLWHTYPIKNFPSVSSWFGELIEQGQVLICHTVLEECKKNAPELYNWLKGLKFNVYSLTQEVILVAKDIESKMGIAEYSPKGVDENDLFIIATAKIVKRTLITNEAPQRDVSKINRLAKYKIPAVCQLPYVQVDCVNLIAMITKEKGDHTF